MPKGQFYALAIFVIGRLDTKGVGLKPWGSLASKLAACPVALDPHLWCQACQWRKLLKHKIALWA